MMALYCAKNSLGWHVPPENVQKFVNNFMNIKQKPKKSLI